MESGDTWDGIPLIQSVSRQIKLPSPRVRLMVPWVVRRKTGDAEAGNIGTHWTLTWEGGI